MAATVTGLRGAGLGLGRLAWIGMGGWRDETSGEASEALR